ncbi:MAG: HAD-IA family hydrolase [Pseudomonadota bacterium]
MSVGTPASPDLRLIVFDFDGTLVDSQRLILAAMGRAFAECGLAAPPDAQVLGIVGLSLPQAFKRLRPDLPGKTIAALTAGYKLAFGHLRDAAKREGGGAGTSPLYPGARAALARLSSWGPETLLGIATGKGRRGLDDLMTEHDLGGFFTTLQTADLHPSKPHPAMLEACLAETGVAASRAVMVGDTAFDIEMGRAAGYRTIGVAWGYHPVADLHAAGADDVIESFDSLDRAVEALL